MRCLGSERVEWDVTPGYLRRSRLRWLALAHAANGDSTRANEVRARLFEERAHDVEAALARLDVACAANASDVELDALVEAVMATRAQGTRWMLDGARNARERARRLAGEYPY